MGQITATRNLVAIKVVRHAGQWNACGMFGASVSSDLYHFQLELNNTHWNFNQNKKNRFPRKWTCRSECRMQNVVHHYEIDDIDVADQKSKNTFLNILILLVSTEYVPMYLINHISTLETLVLTAKQRRIVSKTKYDAVHWYKKERINSLRPSEAIWRDRSESTLAQVMACCLMAPSHYLSICWFPISDILWHSHESNFAALFSLLNLKIILSKLLSHFPGTNDLIQISRIRHISESTVDVVVVS